MSENLFDLLHSKTKKEFSLERSEAFLNRLPLKKKNSLLGPKIIVPSLVSMMFIGMILMNMDKENISDIQIVQNIEILEEYEALSFLEENDLTIEDMEILLEEDIDENLSS